MVMRIEHNADECDENYSLENTLKPFIFNLEVGAIFHGSLVTPEAA
jgi:hypothetical protein